MTYQVPFRPEEEQIVRDMHAAGARDTHIAAELGRSPSTVHRARKRLGLAALYGPGRPTQEEQKA